MVYRRPLLLLPFLLFVAAVADGAPLSKLSCPSCPTLLQEFNLEARGGIRVEKDLLSLELLFDKHAKELDDLRVILRKAADEAQNEEVQQLMDAIRLASARKNEVARWIETLHPHVS
ncbi:hypothetical protein CF336_g6710 [Tilletia laevis]|uniref:Uncharacterized protein n=1 Tax=Tilletia caries TaxID=13290 RepID=A0A177V831_9BASI|nr:hypothetical protein CF336_g6710 [Tilletia laevis]KAE8195638.1 hypothetical protein CF335_g5050 [Tilletia laevis]KAE8204370.1 hypothetical protein CF328_g1115 [Tilletia controversa]KAE8253651.1 hypothetical protein A4X03_0g5833 [Tilletia caries]